MNDYLNTSIEEFNKFLNEKMTIEEEIALKNVGRWIRHKLVLILIIQWEYEILKINPNFINIFWKFSL